MASGTNGRGSSSTQARRHAKAAEQKADSRREKADGVEGWVAERAGDWELDAREPAWMERQKYFFNPLMDYWFRMEIEGWERLPPPPALLVGVHSGAPFVWDAWTVGYQWWRRYGEDRILHGTAHDMLMAAPGRRRLLPQDGRAARRARQHRGRPGGGTRRGSVAGRRA